MCDLQVTTLLAPIVHEYAHVAAWALDQSFGVILLVDLDIMPHAASDQRTALCLAQDNRVPELYLRVADMWQTL